MSLLKRLMKRSRGGPFPAQKKALGPHGEDVAVTFLQKQGIEILQRNYRCPRGEIDVVAREGSTLVFVEVKTATTGEFGPPEGWVDSRKQRQVGRIAAAYLQEHRVADTDCRFDVVTVMGRQDPSINHIRNAFWIET